MRFVTTQGGAPATSLEWALFDGLAPDGSLYMPETIDRLTPEEIAGLPSRSLVEIGIRVLRPYTAEEISEATLASIVGDALNFPIPLVEVEPGVHALELFHGPTLAFKDIGARVMARLISALHDREAPTSVLVATSGDTGSAVGHAFYQVPHTRVIVLYPDGRVSPRQEAQLTMFNAERGHERARLRDRRQLRRLPAAGEGRVRRPGPPGSRPPHVGQLDQHRAAAAADGLLLPHRRAAGAREADPATPSSRRRAATSAT